MTVTIYHNPQCSKSRAALELIRAAGIAPTIVEYLKTPLDAQAVTALLARMGARPRDILRRTGTPYDDLGLDDPKWTDAELIAFMAAHPSLIERPIVVTPKGAKLCRPPESVQALL